MAGWTALVLVALVFAWVAYRIAQETGRGDR
jgi:hypothetical protein